ncbi:MAG: tRNA (guanosine(46)-N7)-methyltransferase TrmB [Chlorobi bacterium]|nr:tRNA (guanosine(46)-N7)-methyltransferase TrmB [Chlorobiota bacterium]
MGKNKLAKFAEMAGYNHVFQATYADLMGGDFYMKGKWSSDFFKNNNPVVLELGCGKGEYTVGLARIFPDKNFVGVDIKGARMHRGATDSFNEGLKNVAFIRTHIEMIDSFFAENEVSEIWLTFPDPQMKKTRKRMTSTRFLNLYKKILVDNGIIHLKTDSNFMYTYTRELLKVNGIEPEVDEKDLYASGFNEPILSIKTYYENKWLGHGIPIKYLRFRLSRSLELKEPDVDIEYDDYRSAGRGVKVREVKNKNA